ncbi:MAG TPA: GspE/PulE family protein, partial [bacterium]|nr:GspE/PulE family protein [bacterium]
MELSTAWLLARSLCPLAPREDGTVVVLAADPGETLALDVLAAVLDRPVIVKQCDRNEIRRRLLERAESRHESLADIASPVPAEQAADGYDGGEPVDRELLGGDPDHPRVIRLVNTLLTDAVKHRASDVHLAPDDAGMRVRYRIDGMLEDIDLLSRDVAEPVISRIKVMARMDVSQRRRPQDGSMNVTYAGRPLDIRVSTVPTPAGERVALRLLQRTGAVTGLDALGMPRHMQDAIDGILHQTQGMLLVAGPTGSGKTTTLYACLDRIDTASRNTITIEDPVEYDIPGISQIQVGRDRSFGFADGLRSLLRQDPDVLMVGEIRDGETAGIAFQAALTGHLILSTIHTVDPAAAVIRLLDLGVEPPLIAETLAAVMDQRLIR